MEKTMEDRIDEKLDEIKTEQQKDYTELNALANNTKKGLVIGCLTYSVSKLGGNNYKLIDVTRMPRREEIKEQIEKMDVLDSKLKEEENKNLDEEVKKEQVDK